MHRIEQSYLEERVLAANKLELIAILYEQLEFKLSRVKWTFYSEDVEIRHQCLNFAIDIVFLLKDSLNFNVPNQEIPETLDRLYEFLVESFIKINLHHDITLLKEVIYIVKNMRETWGLLIEEINKNLNP